MHQCIMGCAIPNKSSILIPIFRLFLCFWLMFSYAPPRPTPSCFYSKSSPNWWKQFHKTLTICVKRHHLMTSDKWIRTWKFTDHMWHAKWFSFPSPSKHACMHDYYASLLHHNNRQIIVTEPRNTPKLQSDNDGKWVQHRCSNWTGGK